MKDKIKNFFLAGAIQPILTIVLVILLVVLIFQYVNKNTTSNNGAVEKEIGQTVTFDSATEKFLNGNYDVYSRGSLYVKESTNASLDPSKTTPTPSVTQVNLIENKYDGMIFLLSNGKVKKLDIRAYGQNESLFFNKKGEIVFLNNTNKSYTTYPIPDDSETSIVKLFEGTNGVLQQSFPLQPLIQDYKNGLFNPIERAENIYSGQWKSALFTNDEVAEVVIQTDSVTGLFKSFNITNTQPPSQISFEFRNRSDIENYDQIPADYKGVEIPTKYKTK